MSRLLLWGVMVTMCASWTSGGEFTIKPLTEGSVLHEMKQGLGLFPSYAEGKTTVQTLPPEVVGLPAIAAQEPYVAQVFEISEPARAYWVFYPRVYTPIPAGWNVFRQRAFSTPFDYRDTRSDVYYKVFPAGKHEVKVPPLRHVNLGFKPLSRMTVKDCVLNIHSPTRDGVFRTGDRLSLNLEIDNPTGQSISGMVRWRYVGGESERCHEVRLPPGQVTRAELPLTNLSTGFYLMEAELWVGEEKIDARRFPIGVFDVPPPDPTVSEPFFPVGAYNKFFLTHHPEIARIYLHAVCYSLRRHNLNTLVGPALDNPQEELDIAAQYGIRVLVRVDQDLPKSIFGHKAILAYMFGDEPKAKDLERYKAKYESFVKEHPERPLVTAMVGESVGSLTEDDPAVLWKALGPQVRMARFYPMRKAGYDLLRAPIYKNMLLPSAAFDIIERSSSSPWWYVIQGFGGRPTAEKPDPYWRNPTPEEFTALAHLALAFGARAIISWPLQSHGPEPGAAVALIAQETLGPEDGKYAAFAKVGALIARAKPILLRHQKGSTDVRTDACEVLAVPRVDPQTKRNYVYLVNLDAKAAHTVTVTFARPPVVAGVEPSPVLTSAVDLYSGAKIVLDDKGLSKVATVQLAPGEGQFWELQE